ncbi:MAG: type VI secretion system tube protein Hcp [Enterobacteriaceae bacterium]|jgi:type VI secretion system secreted protein Hcp|nr:type VI secretion system tube protein Hcp [Enterobacteriaceae bacterium]
MSNNIDAFLQLTDIKGEAKDTTHSDWIAVEWFQLASKNSTSHVSKQSGGHGAGIVDLGTLRISPLFDKSSVILHKYLITGKHIDKVALHVRRQGGDGDASQVDWYQIELTNAMVADTDIGFQGGAFSFGFSLAFETFKESYFPQSQNGVKGAEVTFTWDTYKNALK